ncbi:Transcriptional regulator, TetR family [Pseudonocardia sp. Ae168_Ps1]|uniref:TetR/AcrR family transcriptional regulator n=1 Tax=unclassified Pseudonocardia TaxID=2619320 RepID=UPI00094ACED0|nr:MULTISPECIES: TetR/AcrR family transcriptional regulator [unclassified Pseudonocardia]OLL71046.1 Transcriptional regulator, TetR family [Pseudonocardia sp. Ae168_Ps1]OLL77404.1 Transcriptional regulator, TetR family [Pseudonocardia sp. Ae150A_Ps1]OLL88484.1 Transcriptional regulator, TetR family [Pseudonocardia sp. Ae263_Ps1]OLL91493.1 Transcriptional regulator, TetR family [Pseudonocardia sp. Ae356_Ps1]
MGTTTGPAARPLRADAARNHRRIVEAAAAAFESDGPDVALEEIARRAGVGVATLYRRFRTRDLLVRAVLEDVFAAEIEPTAAAGEGNPWSDLAGSLSRAVEAIAGRRTLLKLARETCAFDVEPVHRYGRTLTRLLDRAREAGAVRPELTPRDLSAVLVMALAAVDVSEDDADGTGGTGGTHGTDGGGASADEDRRRYLALLLDGLRPGHPPLPSPPGDRTETGADASFPPH